MISKYTKELLEPIAIESKSMAEVLRKLNLNYNGGSTSYIKKMMKIHNIDLSHFTGQGHNKGKKAFNAHTKESFIKERLVIRNDKEFHVNGTSLKKLLFKFSLKENMCEKCGLNDEWQGEKIALHLDHINGNHFDNRLENLRILCPNCHSQTETFGSKKLKSKNVNDKKKYYCLDCKKNIRVGSKRCVKCSNIFYDRRPEEKLKVSKEELEKLIFIDKMSFEKMATKFKVSSNTIRRRCEKINIDWRNRKIHR